MDDEKEVPKCPADWLSLPVELWSRYIFPHLEYADLLRLRRACEPSESCRKIKVYSDDFIRNNFKSQVREINESNYPVKHFLDVDLPTNSIFINNSSPAFFEDPDMPEFLRLYGDQIAHVRIHHFGTFISPSELHFFSSLPNLLHLDLDFIDATQRDCVSTTPKAEEVKVHRENPVFPENFKNLKTLKLNEIHGCKRNDRGYAWDFLKFCQNLEHFKHPLFEGRDADDHSAPFHCVIRYIKRRHREAPEQPNLRFYDLENENAASSNFDQEILGREYGRLFKLCWERQVKLLNVDSCNFNFVELDRNPKIRELVSLINVAEWIFVEELPNLEKLVVDSTIISSFADEDDVPKWPNLKILDLTIDSLTMEGDHKWTQEFLGFLFGGPENKREKMEDLAIRYASDVLSFFARELIPVARVKNITDTCPFLTKLTLTSWMGTNKQITLFWKGLPMLEEVELDSCQDLGNVAFVGKDREHPDFLKLERLKKVSLKGLDLMPKVTDLVFDLVFRHLKIKRFCLACETPLKKVTVAGIERLLGGEFNNSVEKFPFDGWSLEGVSHEAFLELKLKFRATHMI